jgi:hypothetical protein
MRQSAPLLAYALNVRPLTPDQPVLRTSVMPGWHGVAP